MLVWSELCQLKRTKLHHGLCNTDINRLMHINAITQRMKAAIHSRRNKATRCKNIQLLRLDFYWIQQERLKKKYIQSTLAGFRGIKSQIIFRENAENLNKVPGYVFRCWKDLTRFSSVYNSSLELQTLWWILTRKQTTTSMNRRQVIFMN